ncbi:MAG: isochorismatase family protein [Clostridiales bacterium]|nr:isochorismatase family protein [Clostridiales bacterium]
MRISIEDTLVLFIDFQEKLVPVVKEKEALLKNTEIFIKGLNLLEVPMIITRQYPKGLGDTVASIKNCLDANTSTMDKITFSCMDDENIAKKIAMSGRKTIIVCGIEAHICVLQTVIDLIENGYRVFLAEDCISSQRNHDLLAGKKRAYIEGAIPATCESLLFELTRKAGTTTFKEISKLVKQF